MRYQMEPAKFHSQLDLPYQETNHLLLRNIFITLEREFDLKKNSKQVFIDLGSGNGQVITYCAVNYGIKSIGIEIDPVLIEEAKMAIRSLKLDKGFKKSQIEFITGDFYYHNLKTYDYIYIYSLPTMHKYLSHVFQTAKRNATIISHRYPLQSLIQLIEFKFKLDQNLYNQKISTFFYRRI